MYNNSKPFFFCFYHVKIYYFTGCCFDEIFKFQTILGYKVKWLLSLFLTSSIHIYRSLKTIYTFLIISFNLT